MPPANGHPRNDVHTLLRARAVQIVDEHGRPRANLSGDAKAAGLVLYDEQQRPSISVSSGEGGSYVALHDSGGRLVAQLAASPQGAPCLSLFDDAGAARLIVGIDETGTLVIRATGDVRIDREQPGGDESGGDGQ